MLLLLLSGCGGSSIYTPVSERSIGSPGTPAVVRSGVAPSTYTVRRGDTLYAIAFRYGLDYRQLARNNGISEKNYSIYVGQKLSLKQRVVSSSQTQKKVAAPTKQTVSSAASTKSEPKQKTPVKATAKPTVAKQSVVNRALKWRWPGSGRVIQGFSNSGKVNKGINLAGKTGDSVLAAEAGRVVYAGSGLLGYGKLVIINHNQQFLSAYAHNSRILVKENDMVKTGQKIAEVGSSGATRSMLHFEIRKDGRPVDPIRYLPRNR